MGKILIFTSDFTWDVSLASDFISDNSWKKFDFHKWFHLGRVTGTWQAIRKMSIRTKWNPVGLRKIFIWIFTVKMRTSHTIFYMERHLFFTCARGHVPRDSQVDSQVKLFFWNWREGTRQTCDRIPSVQFFKNGTIKMF